jgi:hydrogenase small subunit
MAASKTDETLVHVLWINAGLSCDGIRWRSLAATQPSIEEIVLGAPPGLPCVCQFTGRRSTSSAARAVLGEPGADTFIKWRFIRPNRRD